MAQNLIISHHLWTHKIPTRWLGCSALPVLQKEKTFFFYDSFHIEIISTKLLHLLAGARHRLPPLWLAVEWLCAAYHWLPEGEWEEHSPHPSPVAERVKAKTPSLPIIWVTLGFGVCLWVCVYGGERKEIKRERVREGEISSICSPPFSLPISLSLHPSSLFLDHPSALIQARPGSPDTSQTTPGPFDSPDTSPSQQLQHLHRWAQFNSSCFQLLTYPPLSCCWFCLFCTHLDLASLSCLRVHILSFACSTFVPRGTLTSSQEDNITEVTVSVFLPPIFYSDINFPSLSKATISSSLSFVQSHPLWLSWCLCSLQKYAQVFKDSVLRFSYGRCISNWFLYIEISAHVSLLFIVADVPGARAFARPLPWFWKITLDHPLAAETWHCTKYNAFARQWRGWLNQAILPAELQYSRST